MLNDETLDEAAPLARLLAWLPEHPERVCQILSERPAADIAPLLLRCLERTVRARAQRALLGALGHCPLRSSPLAVRLLLLHLRSERDSECSRLAARALGHMQNPPPQVLDELELRLFDGRQPVRWAAAQACGRLGQPRESLLKALPCLDNFRLAGEALVRLDPERAAPLLLAARGPDAYHAMWLMLEVPSLHQHLRRLARDDEEISKTWGDPADLARYLCHELRRRALPRCRIPRQLPLNERYGLAAARCVLKRWHDEYPDDFCPLDAIYRLERWILDPTPERRQKLESAAGFGISQFCTPQSFSAGWAAVHAARREPEEAERWAVRAMIGSTGIVPVGGAPEPERLSLRSAQRAVRRAIGRELAAWLSGWETLF